MQDSFFALFALSHKTNQNRTAGHFIGNFVVSRTHVKELGVTCDYLQACSRFLAAQRTNTCLSKSAMNKKLYEAVLLTLVPTV